MDLCKGIKGVFPSFLFIVTLIFQIDFELGAANIVISLEKGRIGNGLIVGIIKHMMVYNGHVYDVADLSRIVSGCDSVETQIPRSEKNYESACRCLLVHPCE